MMYYTDAINGESYKMCWDGGSQQIFRNIPFGKMSVFIVTNLGMHLFLGSADFPLFCFTIKN